MNINLRMLGLALLTCLVLLHNTRLEVSGGNLQSAAQAQAASPADAEPLARKPPMGWNSWDSFGTTITEDDVKANARWMAQHLKRYGWQYVVVDMEWFVTNPVPQGNSKNSKFTIDDYGRYTPALNRFPAAANGAGFKPLAEYIHSLGLKFGIHILRGIPKQAVERNVPIAGGSFHASEAANESDTCPWNPDNYGLRDTPAGQAYYDSIAALYAEWGVDFLKVDCISSHPYKGDEIRMLSGALRKTGRPMVLSLSPGAAPIEKVDEMRQYAQLWRISNDVWDLWHSTVDYPQGVVDQFPRAEHWAGHSEPGHWPDADMLPLGFLGPAPGWGKTRNTRLTHDEERTLFTLWCIFRSPLMMGGNLPRNDAWTTSLLTNPEVLEVDQDSHGSHVAMNADNVVVWLAQSATGNDIYIAAFNLGETPRTLQYDWQRLGLPAANYKVRDLWSRRNLASMQALSAQLPAHGCVLYRLSAEQIPSRTRAMPLLPL